MEMKTLRCLVLALVFLPLGARAENAITVLQENLVKFDDGKVVEAEGVDLAKKEYVALYYSAHWCPPCRKFTPDLSAWYDAASKKHPEFELVFVSSDKDEDAMKGYMEWGKMNYPAVAYSKRRDKAISQHGASGIPYMVVLDKDGNQVLGKKAGEDWKYPGAVLEDLKALLEK